jgi:sugar fermentation stimulation protein A
MVAAAGDESGIYQLHLHLPKPVRLTIGRLGRFRFPAGRYVYTGSALSGLERRIARHRRKEKRLHWHIDYLLRHASIEDVIVIPTRDRLECETNLKLLRQEGARIVAPRFGSSGCRCPAHLIHLGCC